MSDLCVNNSSTQSAGEPATPAARWHNNALHAGFLLVAVALWQVYAVRQGLTVGSAVKMTLAVLVTQILPGALVWRTVRPRAGWLIEDVCMGFAMGQVLAVFAAMIGGLSRLYWLNSVLPLAVGAVLVAVPATRARITQAQFSRLPWWWVPLASVGSVAAFADIRSYFVANAPSLPAGAWQPHIDTYLHLSLAAEIKNRGPVAWPTVAGEDLGYQWMGHAWIAQVSSAAHVELIDVLTRFMPTVLPVIVAVSVGVATLRLTHRPWLGVLASFITMLGGEGSPFGFPTVALAVRTLSPTLGIGAPPLIAMVVLLALRWRKQALPGAVVLLPFLTVVAAGTKGSTSPLIVAGLGVAAVAMALWNRSMVKRIIIDFVVVAVCLALTFVLVFHGSSAGLKFSPGEAATQTALFRVLNGFSGSHVLAGLALVVAVWGVTTRGLVAYTLPLFPESRRDPITWLLGGGIVAGTFAVGVFAHPGQSQYYFAATAVPLMGIAGALAFGRIWDSIGRPGVAAGLVVLGIGGGVAAVSGPRVLGGLSRGQDQLAYELAIWSGVSLVVVAAIGVLIGSVTFADRRWSGAAMTVGTATLVAGFVLAVTALEASKAPSPRPVQLTANLATSQNQLDAARYIRDHSAVDDLVMTNRHCTLPREPFNGCDSRRWLVTGFSERQSLIEGWTATPMATKVAPNGRDSITVDYWKPEILRLNDGFIAAPTAAAAQQLWDLGVRWVYVEHTRPYAPTLEPYATPRLRNADADVYQLNAPR